MTAPSSAPWRIDEVTSATAFGRARYLVNEFLRASAHRLTRRSELRTHTLRRVALANARCVVVMVVRDEAERMPYVLQHYRTLGFDHFLVIDNRSADGLLELLDSEADVSTFIADGSYWHARVGSDWVNALLGRYCRDKWVLYTDADELLVYAHHDEVGIGAVVDRLERHGQESLPCLMVDLYGEGPVALNLVEPGGDPTSVCNRYDSSGYHRRLDVMSDTVWIKGGVRGRLFFPDIQQGPSLNKTPLVRWRRWHHFLKSSHEVWPPSMNRPATKQTDRMDGALLHFRFLSERARALEDETLRSEHTAEYDAYAGLAALPTLCGPTTHRYRGWRSLVEDGLMTDVDWT